MVAYRRKRKMTKRPAGKRPIPRGVMERSYKINRMMELSTFTITGATEAWTTTSYTFRLADLPSFTDFTNLFDQYRIDGVKVTFMPRYFDPVSGGASGSLPATATPAIWIQPDEDSDSNMTSQFAAMQSEKARMIKNPYRPFSVYCRPKFSREVRVTAGIAGANPGSGWLDTLNSGVIHYGVTIGGYLPGYAGGSFFNNAVYDVYAKMYLRFKEPC